MNWLMGMFAIALILLGAPSLFRPPSSGADKLDQDFYRFPVEFRAAEKRQTVLGRLSRPLYIYPQSDGKLLAFKQSGEEVAIPFSVPDLVEAKKRVFLDEYSDRIFYISGGVGKVFQIGNKQAEILPDSIQQELKKQFCVSSLHFCSSAEIAAARGDVLVIGGGVNAAEDEYAAFDIKTGELLYRTQVAGYDISKMYRIYLPEETLVLTLNSKGEPHTRYGIGEGGLHRYTFGSQSEYMDIYLEHSDLSYTPLKMDMDPAAFGSAEEDWRSVVFTIGKSPVLKTKKPLYSYLSKAKNARPYHDNLFSVRDLFLATDGSLLLEVDDGLLLVDPKRDSAQFLDNEDEVERLLHDATLIAPDAKDYWIWGNCPFSESLNNQKRLSGFCLT